MREIKEMKQSFSSEQKQKLEKIEDQFHASMLALDNQIKQRLAKLDQLQNAVTVEFNPTKLKAQVRELEEFKAQFVNAIKANAERYNAKIKRMNEQSQKMEKQFLLRVEKIDKKIAELDAFEKVFAKEMGISLEKMLKKK